MRNIETDMMPYQQALKKALHTKSEPSEGGGSGGGGSLELVVDCGISNPAPSTLTNITPTFNMEWEDAQKAIINGELKQAFVVKDLGDEYNTRIMRADVRCCSLDDGMSRSIVFDYEFVVYTGGSTVEVYHAVMNWTDYGSVDVRAWKIN